MNHIKQLLLFATLAAPTAPSFLFAAECTDTTCTFEVSYVEPTRQEPVSPNPAGLPLTNLTLTTLYIQPDPWNDGPQPLTTITTKATSPAGGGTVTLTTPPIALPREKILTIRFWATATNPIGEGRPILVTHTIDRITQCPPGRADALTVR